MLEIERTFLLKSLPDDLDTYQQQKMADLYLPTNSRHPLLRLRRNNNQFMITKKYPKVAGDNSVMVEETIVLTEDEYDALSKADGKLTQKTRYKKAFNGYTCEVDVFEENLLGLMVVDFEFESSELAKQFTPPSYCGLEITHIEGLAGGMIAGKSYEEVKRIIDTFRL